MPKMSLDKERQELHDELMKIYDVIQNPSSHPLCQFVGEEMVKKVAINSFMELANKRMEEIKKMPPHLLQRYRGLEEIF
ncbi:hypothetical protein [Terasakiella pusilla]|uniref:hypothetical protein n=1 Tax=Terasakiella pusilla TaxID=64973 RepID=UPI00048BB26F|nr:hypothetical protein [Terasakiella pusilla]